MSAAFACDGPECEKFARAQEPHTDDWIHVTSGGVLLGHFCSWQCLNNYDAEAMRDPNNF